MVSSRATSPEEWCLANAEVTLESVEALEILQRRDARLLQNDKEWCSTDLASFFVGA
jgi:hypothetical protein